MADVSSNPSGPDAEELVANANSVNGQKQETAVEAENKKETSSECFDATCCSNSKSNGANGSIAAKEEETKPEEKDATCTKMDKLTIEAVDEENGHKTSLSTSTESGGLNDNGSSRIEQGKKKRMISNYEVLQCIGKGAQGVVHRCKNVENGEIVAIKSIKNQREIWRRNSSKAMKEVELLKSCDHTNLVKFYEVINNPEDTHTRLVFEYVDAVKLDKLSDKNLMRGQGVPLDEDYSRQLFRQLVSALNYLHKHHILHRDIKPSNLLIDRKTGVLKVSDFGIALRSKKEKASRVLGRDDNLLAIGNIFGTPAFLPPEYYRLIMGDHTANSMYVHVPADQAKSERTRSRFGMSLSIRSSTSSGKGMKTLGSKSSSTSVIETNTDDQMTKEDDDTNNTTPVLPYFHGRPADIWAAGITLYAFTYGQLPFTTQPRRSSFQRMTSSSDMTEMETLQDNIINATLAFPGVGLGVSTKQKRLLERLLEKNPNKRIQMHDILNDPWLCRYEPMPLLNGEQPRHRPTPPRRASVSENQFFERLGKSLRSARSKAHVLSTKARLSLRSSTSRHNSDNLSDSEPSDEDDDSDSFS
mmetsp:Transcript_7049/g.9179  ORF Transcript_7049/g.9179 Transcript_7049/m.9179 type:complete len:585 (-) Transcript_7049:1296-3050(-)|eukprot:CAMPEP_0184021636 /NCGR_PEP_ID=MMETSP0954-20121128/10058_1 /TAXON_ID=627963 /ORGANISM="Aplanochytrium sp, Strain PBS07" /LENGTH=584 /DNA_ID=CAMNT_0026303717 /DNA_START=355 /DNA_END=2109 /DNA_ORIENTATION=-